MKLQVLCLGNRKYIVLPDAVLRYEKVSWFLKELRLAGLQEQVLFEQVSPESCKKHRKRLQDIARKIERKRLIECTAYKKK